MFISLVADKNSLPQNIIELAEALAEDYPIAFAGQGTKVTFNKIEADGIAFKVAKNSDGFVIDYNCTAACARGIASALAGICCEESTPMNSVGAMLDVSRGMVMKVDRVKNIYAVWQCPDAICCCCMLRMFMKFPANRFSADTAGHTLWRN